MITRLYRSILCGAVLFAGTFSASAQQASEQAESGADWFNRMAEALTELNFEASLVHVHGDQIEPYQWLQGNDPETGSTELLIQMNGPDFRILRVNNKVAHFNTSSSNYALKSDTITAIFPAAFSQPFERLSHSYQVTVGGGARVLGRNAQHIRILSRDNQRYSYALWIDRKHGMPLKMMMMNQSGDVVEQMQLTSLSVRNTAPEITKEISNIEMPPLLKDLRVQSATNYSVEPQWAPRGFKLLSQQSHNLVVDSTPVDHYLFSDGLAEYSVYVAELTEGMETDLALSSSHTLFSKRYNNFLVTVVGQVPLAMAQRIAAEVK
ncbi:MAG: MucB/RseB C-terminal domain-containing protein [Idiomarinaceae bacterium]|uniref:MucB/RseB C-terminal domain-containing protein n=1 Tax=Idiomarina sp. 28-8 TaxID=1260624 RepID=UPI00030B9940|nr:MucB/RseB C-terminal domain-containing protein [Idiomarina sp. 28-8]NWO02610.1 MucB/RseB C-terminal domain-containing protein [Idiomarinaceae bacterium]